LFAARFQHMNRRDKIRLSLARIKVTKRLVAKQEEFITLAKSIGFEPVHAPATLERFRTQLSTERKALLRLTRSGKKTLTAPERPLLYPLQKAA
jgi:hypothetical protein